MYSKTTHFTYFLLLLLISLFVLNSCEKLELDTKGQVTQLTYYTGEKELEDGLVGIFATFHRGDWALDIHAAYSGADDLTARMGSGKAVMLEGDQFFRPSTYYYENSWLGNIWNYYYKTILACNSFLAYANSTEIDVTVLNNARANAHFMRGMLYFRLATIYQDIPMPLVPAPDTTLSKTPMRVVIEQSIQDLSYAAEWANGVRDTDPSIPDGQVTKTAAKAFLAKTYLQLTGWPFFETDKWENVKELTQAIIEEGVYSLSDDYAFCFQDPYQMNREMIFSHICQWGEWPEKAESRYYGYKWCDWGDAYIEYTFYDNFPEGYRKRFSTVSEKDTIYNDPVTKHFLRFIDYWHHPMVSKFTYATIEGLPEFVHKWQSSNDIPMMRFSEVLLMYAEACAHLGESDEAIEKLNWVKRRAYAKGLLTQEEVATLPDNFWMNVDSDIDYTQENLPTNEAIIEAIINERAYEFLGEPGGVRWLDLLRLEKIAEVTANRDERENTLLGDPADPANWFFPIPYSETVANPNLK